MNAQYTLFFEWAGVMYGCCKLPVSTIAEWKASLRRTFAEHYGAPPKSWKHCRAMGCPAADWDNCSRVAVLKSRGVGCAMAGVLYDTGLACVSWNSKMSRGEPLSEHEPLMRYESPVRRAWRAS